MYSRALEDLKASIKKWKGYAEEDCIDNILLGPLNCPLCVRFQDIAVNNCGACPIRLRTSQHGCAGTPYADAVDAKRDWSDAIIEEDDDLIEAEKQVWVVAAYAEISFLESLLPENSRPEGELV